MSTIAIDTETYYDEVLSYANMHYVPYCMHSRLENIFLVSYISSKDGNPVALPPEKIDWDFIFSHDTFVFANAIVELCVLCRLVQLGVIPRGLFPEEFEDTYYNFWKRKKCYDISAYAASVGYERNLENLSKLILGKELDKDIRKNMKRVTKEQVLNDPACIEYAKQDAVVTYTLFRHFEPTLRGDAEMDNFDRILRQELTPWPVDITKICNNVERLEEEVEEEMKKLGLTKLSSAQLRKGLENKGIFYYGDSFGATNKEFLEFCEKHPEASSFNSILSKNRTASVLKKLLMNCWGSNLYAAQKYYGTKTGRPSGTSGFNIFNLSKHDQDDKPWVAALRDIFPKDVLIYSYDLNSIEANYVLFTFALDAYHELKSGKCSDLYEVAARRFYNYSDPAPLKSNEKLRNMYKPMFLGHVYQGFFAIMEATGLSKYEMSRYTKSVRQSLGLEEIWDNIQQKFVLAVSREEDEITFPLKNGRRDVIFYDPQMYYRKDYMDRNVQAFRVRNWKGQRGRVKMFPGKVVENMAQHECACIFQDSLSSLERYTAKNSFITCYDSANFFVGSEHQAKWLEEKRQEVFGHGLEWLPGFKLEAEGEIKTTF